MSSRKNFKPASTLAKEDESRTRLVIIGRPNVGKSTLFNRLLGRRRALVHDEPGVTRDRLEEKAEWWVKAKPYPVLLVDTGGLGGERWASEIEQQVGIALERADLVIILFDGQMGLTPQDEEVILKLKQSGVLGSKTKGHQSKIPVIGVVNKVDAPVHEDLINDFYAAGLEELLTISAEHGRGIDDLQEAIALAVPAKNIAPITAEVELEEDFEASEEVGEEEFEEEMELDNEFALDDEASPDESTYPRIAIVGRPNVGKSTMINSLTGDHRMITSTIAGTTVDAVDSMAELAGKPFVLIDTAGIRRKSKTEKGIEVLSVVQARKALERCDVAVLLLDGETGITDQDEKIGGIIEEVGCGVVLVLNKWDTQVKNAKFTKEIAAKVVRSKMPFLRYAPILFVSALQGKGFDDLGDLVLEIIEQRKLKISTREFTEWVRKESEIHNPDNAKFYLSHQSGRNPPSFVCHVSNPDKVHFSLRRHLVNAMRAKWGFMGSPVRLLFVEGNNERKAKKPDQLARERKAARAKHQKPKAGKPKPSKTAAKAAKTAATKTAATK